MHTHESAWTGLFQQGNSQDLVTLQQARKICDGGVAAGMTTKSPSPSPCWTAFMTSLGIIGRDLPEPYTSRLFSRTLWDTF